MFLPRSTRSQPLQVAVVFLTLASTALIVIVGIAYAWKLTRWLSRIEEGYDSNTKLALFWCFMYVLWFTNITDTIFSLGLFSMMNSMEPSKIYIILKIVFTVTIAVAGTTIGLRTQEKNLPKFPTPPEPPVECCLPHWFKRKTDHTFAMCNIFLFVFLTGISVISTTALMVVHPILVLSTVAYIITSMSSVVALLALTGLTLNRFGIDQDWKDCWRNNCAQLCEHCLRITALIAMSLLLLLCLIIMSKDDHTYTNEFLQGISSFIPSAILAVISYFAKNKLTANKRESYENKLRQKIHQL